MSKTKNSGLSHYEILFLLPNKYTEDEAKQVVKKAGEMITSAGGQITLEEYWGKKKLAYIIKQNHYGYYSLFEFDLEGKDLAKLDKAFRLSSEILRHQIVTKAVRTPEEIKIEKERREKIEQKKNESVEKKTVRPAGANASTPAPAAPSTASKTKKVELKDLDEKLEGILSAKDLL